MPDAKKCGDCGGKLGVKAYKCRCGWVMPGAPRPVDAPPLVIIACCFSNCAEGAICRLFTKTGWANVCRTHYPKIETAPRGYAYDSPVVVEARKAYENSFAYRQKHGIAAPKREDRSALEAELAGMREKMSEAGFRQPGEDDDDPLAIAADPQAYLDRAPT